MKKLLRALVAFLVVTSSLVGSQAAEATPLTWQTATESAVQNGNIEAMAYGNGTFVGISANTIATSPDGGTWTRRDFPVASSDCGPLSTTWIALTYGGGLFVAVGWGGACSDKVMTSPDGISWSVRSAPGADFLDSVAYGNGRYVAADRNGGILSSPDGITWTRHDAPGSWWGITFGNGKYVAVGNDTSGKAATATSVNGTSWEVVSQTNTATNSSISFGNGTFVVVQPMGEGALGLLTSADGLIWSNRTAPGPGWAVAFGNGRFQVVGGSYATSPPSGVVHSSTDGIAWSVETATVGPLLNIAFGNGIFLAVSNSGAVMTASAPAPVASISSGSTPNSQVAAIPAGVTSATLPATAELPTVSLNFAAAGGSATATVAPIANPASASNTPFTITGTTKIVDIQVTGVTGPVTVCLDGAATNKIFHYTGGTWDELPQSTYVNGQVCGVTTSFSPFAAAAPRVAETAPVAKQAPLYTGPIISGRLPRVVSTEGTSEIAITGDRLAQVKSVILEGNPLTIISKSDSQIVVNAPAHSAGLVDLLLKGDSVSLTFQDAVEYKAPVVVRVPVTTAKSVGLSSASAKTLTLGQRTSIVGFVDSASAGAVLTCSATYVSKADAANARTMATAACSAAKKANTGIITRVSAPVLVKSKQVRKILLSLTH